jgi:hypothetical protein
MKTTINNDERIFIAVDSFLRSYACNLEGLNDVINVNDLKPGYLTVK